MHRHRSTENNWNSTYPRPVWSGCGVVMLPHTPETEKKKESSMFYPSSKHHKWIKCWVRFISVYDDLCWFIGHDSTIVSEALTVIGCWCYGTSIDPSTSSGMAQVTGRAVRGMASLCQKKSILGVVVFFTPQKCLDEMIKYLCRLKKVFVLSRTSLCSWNSFTFFMTIPSDVGNLPLRFCFMLTGLNHVLNAHSCWPYPVKAHQSLECWSHLCLMQIVTLKSSCISRNPDSSVQTEFFHCSTVHFLAVVVHSPQSSMCCSFREAFLLSTALNSDYLSCHGCVAYLSASTSLAIFLWPLSSTKHFCPYNHCSIDVFFPLSFLWHNSL